MNCYCYSAKIIKYMAKNKAIWASQAQHLMKIVQFVSYHPNKIGP